MRARALRLAVAVLAVVGAAIAAYLTYTHYAHTTIACPIGGGGCEEVQSSRYAEIGGVPVAALGLALYAVVLGLAGWGDVRAQTAVLGLALAGAAFAAYLLVIQLAVIDAVCAWCIGNDVVISLLALAALGWLRSSAPDAAPSARSGRGSPSGSHPSP